jgi:hypothetical protein
LDLSKAVELENSIITASKITGTFPKISAHTARLSNANTELNSKSNTDPGKNTQSNSKVNTNPGKDSEPKTSPGTVNTNTTSNIDSKPNTTSNPVSIGNAETTNTATAVAPAKSNSLVMAAVGVILLTVIGAVGYVMMSGNENTIKTPVKSPSPIVAEVKEVSVMDFYMETDNGKQLTGSKPFFLGKDQRFRFHFLPKERGYLYIISPSENNFSTMLTKMPIPETGLESNLVEAGAKLTFPAKGWLRTLGAGYYWTIIFSNKPLEKPKFLASEAGKQLTEQEQKELEEMVEGFFKQHGKEPVVNDSGTEDKPTRSVLVKEDELKKGLFIFKLLTE